MGLETSNDLATFDDWDDRARIVGIAFDRCDVNVRSGNVRMQFFVNNAWVPGGDGILCRRGLFYSRPGLSLAYPPRGPVGVRFKRDTAGIAANVDVELYSLE